MYNIIAKIFAANVARKLDLQEGTAMETKKWYKSKGLWTGIVTTLIGAYVSVDTQVGPNAGFDLPNIPDIVFVFLGALGIYSRATADTKLTK